MIIVVGDATEYAMTLLANLRVETVSISVVFAAVFILYRFIVYPLLLSPLARIPNAHWSSPLSPLWILYIRFMRRENAVLYELHKRHGPVVRLGPGDLSINDIDAVRTIYGGGFDKTDWYSVFDNYGVQCMFSALPSKDHSTRKRVISNVYSKSSIHNSAALRAQAHVVLHDRLLPTLRDSAHASQAPQGIDVHALFAGAAMDFITAYIFGARCGTDFIRRQGYREHWMHLYKARSDYGFFPQELPLLTRLLRYIPLCSPYPTWVDLANDELGKWNGKMCNEAMASGNSARAVPDEKVAVSVADEPVVLRALEAGLQKGKISDDENDRQTTSSSKDLTIHSELFDHVLAGQETAGIAMTYIAWHLSKSPEVQQFLQNELRTLSPGIRMSTDANVHQPTIPDPKTLDALPVLHAVIMETLRLHAPIPGPQPRRTPNLGCQLGGFAVPGGVRVAALAHTLHRDEGVFPKPDEWDHTRWMVDGTANGDPQGVNEARRAMDRQFWAFSSGGRMCIGSNFAMHEIKLIVAAIYSNFTTHIVDDEGMEQADGYTVGPVSGRLYLKFEELG